MAGVSYARRVDRSPKLSRETIGGKVAGPPRSFIWETTTVSTLKITQSDVRKMTRAQLIKLINRLVGEQMTNERAIELNGRVVETIVSEHVTGERRRLPAGVPLEELLVAARIVDSIEPTDNGDGTKTLHLKPHPRLIALHYAFDHYEQDPYDLLRALGFNPQ